MIQVYLPDNSNYESNGNMVLFPTECTIEATLNAEWVLNLKHPIDQENRWLFIQEDGVLKVPSWNGDQLYRIKNVEKTLTEISVIAYPVFLDAANEVFLFDVRPTEANGISALNQIFANTKYSCSSDIIKTATAYYQNVNAIYALNGDSENSFTNRWGGQIIYDNYKVIVNQKAGSDNGVVISYGKNLTGINQSIDTSAICTRIIPQAYNGYMLEGKTPWVDSPYIDDYPVIYSQLIKFDDVKLAEDAQEDEISFPTLEQLRDELIRRSNLKFKDENIDKETVTLEIDLILLQNTQEYSEFEELEKISLGDIVTCRNSRLGIETSAQAIKVTYNCLSKKTEKITIGQFQQNYFNDNTLTDNNVSQITNNDGTINAGMIQGILNGALAQLRAQSSAAQKQAVRAILFEDLDPESELFGALAIGTQGILIAKERTENGNEWNWRTAITANGMIADELVGQYIRGIAIEADKGNIAGFDLTSEGFTKTWSYTKPDGTPYSVTFEISSTSNESNSYLIKIFSDEFSEYLFTITDDGIIECNGIFCKGNITCPQINVNSDDESGTQEIRFPFTARASDGETRWRQVSWYINSDTHIGCLQPRDMNGTERTTCQIGESAHRWNKIFLFYDPDVVSDPKFKKNIKTLDDKAVEFIKGLNPCSYNMIDDLDTDSPHNGFLAPEVAKTAEKTIGKSSVYNYDSESDSWSMAYSELIAPLVKTVQFLLNENEKLQSEIKNKFEEGANE